MVEPTESTSSDATDDPPSLVHPERAMACATATPSKAERTLKPLTAILICLISLVASFTSLALSAKTLHLSTLTVLDQAAWDYNAAHNITIREGQARQRLEKLQKTTLRKHFWELQYEECLARGLNTADVHFLGRDYADYEDVRNATLTWVKTNCDRIFFTPDAVKPQAVGKVAVWHRRLRERSLKAVGIVRNWLAQVPRWKSGWKAESSSSNTTTRKVAPVSDSKHIYLPRGFRLVGCDTPPCRLGYAAPGNNTLTQTPTQALDAALETFVTQQDVEYSVRKVTIATAYTAFAFMVLEVLMILAISCIDYLVYGWRWDVESLRQDIEAGLAIQIAATVLLFQLIKFHLGHHLTVELPFTLGVIGLASFLMPNDIVPSTRLLVAATKELAAILYGAPTPASTKKTPVAVPSVRRISPDTTLREDLNVTLEALRAGNLDEASRRERQGEDLDRASGEPEDLDFATEQPHEDQGPEVSDCTSAPSSEASDWSVVESEWPA